MKKQIRNFLLLTTMTTISIYGINKAISVSSIRKNLLKSDNGKFFTWRYGEIFYTKQGKGSPVLLIHDLNPASSSYEWEKCIKHLAKNHTVYAIDLLGCGQSDKPNMTYSNYLFVQLITDFIKNVIGEKADIITTGNSASFTLMACNMNPEHFNKIIVLNPTNLVELCASPNKEKNALIPPFKVIDGFGVVSAETLCKARAEKPFISQDDLLQRGKISKTNLKDLKELGVLDKLNESNQLSLFDFM